ncbi:MAG: ABC transporter ATP-binding protein [Burkholderiaceae bacterium]|jgi:branched-chain amino acid transport system ATP-binding protein|nr:ABC transporter ATP-binding protein [Burkholderiaceae bacterium]
MTTARQTTSAANAGATQSAPALEVRGLIWHTGRSAILRGLDLSVRAGERMALIGPNGAGKTSLFNLISGRVAPTAGAICLNGQRIDGKKPHQIHRMGLARSFQITHLFARLSVFENLRVAALGASGQGYALWRALARLPAVNARAETLLHSVQLQARRDTPAGELTHAQQRALELGVTLAGNAHTILLDEPTAGMSQSETGHFMALIRALTAGKTLLMVEHDMNVVFGLADRIAVLANGALLACDTPQAVRADARVRQAYLGPLPDADAGADADAAIPTTAATNVQRAGRPC